MHEPIVEAALVVFDERGHERRREQNDCLLLEAGLDAGRRRFLRSIRVVEHRQREQSVRRVAERRIGADHRLPSRLLSIGALAEASNGGAESFERFIEIGRRRRVAAERESSRRLQRFELDDRV